MRLCFVALAVLSFYLAGCSTAKEDTGSKAQAQLQLQTIKINSHNLQVELAMTESERRAGLAFREFLKPDHGMLFVYFNSKIRYFTTAQTTLALSIAFLDKHGKIVDIQQMQPLNETSYESNLKARYVLEVNQGWFDKNEVKVGDTFMLPELNTSPN